MLTSKDIKLLVDTFVTRSEFNHKIEELKEIMVSKDEFRKFFGLVESVFTEVKKMREEQAFDVGAHQRINDDLDSLDKRVKKLENTPSISHQIKR